MKHHSTEKEHRGHRPEVEAQLDPLLRIREVCYMTSLHKATVYRGIQAGTFPQPIRLGPKSVGWRKSDVQAWIDARDTEQLVDRAARTGESLDDLAAERRGGAA